MSEKKPPPLIPPAQVHNRCPVCGEISYSLAGIHPQCSMRQADEKHKKLIEREKALAKLEKRANPSKQVTPWQKCCPKCSTLQHVRKSACGCGHTFTAKARPPTPEGEQS